MSEIKPEQAYQQRIDRQELLAGKLQKAITWLSIARLGSFLGSFAILYLYAASGNPLWMGLFILILVLFFFFVKRYIALKVKMDHSRHLLDINKNELEILEGQLSKWADGKEYIDQESYAEDLDIFGQGSLFHLLNRTGTPFGKRHLASILVSPFLEKNTILDHQEAIKELSQEIDLRQKIHAYALEAREEISEEAEKGLESLEISLKKIPVGLRWMAPAIIVLSVAVYIFTEFYSFIILSVLVNLFIAGLYARKIQKAHKAVSGNRHQLSAYASMFRAISEKHFTSGLMKDLKGKSDEAFQGFRKLSNISEMFDRRMNLLVYFFLNSLYLYDFFTIRTLQKWIAHYGIKMHSWFEMLGKLEYINSLAGFSFNNPDFHFPEPLEEHTCIIAVNMGHPLLPDKQRVNNNLTIGCQEKLFLITGSNMSGKSTFLKTAGVNMILARCGSPVCADEFRFKPMEILTSIHLSDSLRENKSLFFSELERLSLIIDKVKTEHDALVLIDEMLKGTNSDDKTNGSMEFIKQLIESNCLSIIATHDIQLGLLEEQYPGIICNYCFESTINDDNLTFDYKIKRGVSKNKNASFLMKKMGIIK